MQVVSVQSAGGAAFTVRYLFCHVATEDKRDTALEET